MLAANGHRAPSLAYSKIFSRIRCMLKMGRWDEHLFEDRIQVFCIALHLQGHETWEEEQVTNYLDEVMDKE